jgi:hypothetical protein
VTSTVPVAKDALSQTFRVLLLLCGGARAAETAILDALDLLGPCPISNHELLFASAKAALSPGHETDRESVGSIPTNLPPELQNVLGLPIPLRHCFVLRVLAGFSLEECARLNIRNVGRCVAAAAEELTRIANQGGIDLELRLSHQLVAG